MRNSTFITDEDRWQAVLARDPLADEQFVFAVQTTGIFCRPSAAPATRCVKTSAFIPMPTMPFRQGFARASAACRQTRSAGAEAGKSGTRLPSSGAGSHANPGGAGAAGRHESFPFPPSV